MITETRLKEAIETRLKEAITQGIKEGYLLALENLKEAIKATGNPDFGIKIEDIEFSIRKAKEKLKGE